MKFYNNCDQSNMYLIKRKINTFMIEHNNPTNIRIIPNKDKVYYNPNEQLVL